MRLQRLPTRGCEKVSLAFMGKVKLPLPGSYLPYFADDYLGDVKAERVLTHLRALLILTRYHTDFVSHRQSLQLDLAHLIGHRENLLFIRWG